MKTTVVFLAATVLCGATGAQEQRLAYRDLVKHLTDLEHLAGLPSPGEQCAQFSSYDRRSRFDAASGKYIDWDANGDGDGIIRQEGDRLVLAEMKGPGCLWRIWSADPKSGHVRIFLDGASEPAVDLPFMGYFDGKNAPFTRAALVHTVSSGWNNYTPIPYLKSCKVVADRGWGLYYHFTYSTFPQGVVVPTFKRQLASDEASALDEANRRLSACGPAEAGTTAISGHFSGEAGKCQALIDGPAAITGLRVKVRLPTAPADVEALRAVTLQIRWDGESEPSVWAPLGDFFGTAVGPSAYQSLQIGRAHV